MLKIRIIPTLLYKNFGLVKGIAFDSWRRVGTALPAIKVYNNRQVDELVFLDIAANSESRAIDYAEVDALADDCFMPFTVGGGVRTFEDVQKLLRAGADKVALNTAAVENPELIQNLSKSFGAQCIVVSIDVKRNNEGKYTVFTHSGKQATSLDPIDWAKKVVALGAGEILLTSIDRDGTMTGYDLEITSAIVKAVSVPVIASGGAGNYEHMFEVISRCGVSAVAAASIFHFTEQTPMEAKQYLHQKGVHVRL